MNFKNFILHFVIKFLSFLFSERVVNYLIKWNTNTLYSDVGQFILQKVLDTSLPSDCVLTKQQCRDLQAYTGAFLVRYNKANVTR